MGKAYEEQNKFMVHARPWMREDRQTGGASDLPEGQEHGADALRARHRSPFSA